MQFSSFTDRFSGHSGIVQLMEDLGAAMAGDNDLLMLGGGNPAHIPEVQEVFQQRIQRLLENPKELNSIFGNYGPPRGDVRFIQALADFFKKNYDWDISEKNIVLTSGSQTGFFLLFNSLAGKYPDGKVRKILLPLVPEYIGYSDVGLVDNMFVAGKPVIETFADRSFKYHVDFDELVVDDSIGAICVSRPTNPTGNVLTDDEIRHLHKIAEQYEIPLIIDNAYGMPFPKIIFTEVTLEWSEHTILCMSLSKLGLPGVRTGVIIASEEISNVITQLNGIMSLALGGFGPALALELIESGEVIELSEFKIKPYYASKVERASRMFHDELKDLDYYIHKPEGALFLWLWFPNLSITSEELYNRLKERGVLIISGHYFFPGLKEDWQHKHECIRVSYAMDDEVVSKGIIIIAEEIRNAQGKDNK